MPSSSRIPTSPTHRPGQHHLDTAQSVEAAPSEAAAASQTTSEGAEKELNEEGNKSK